MLKQLLIIGSMVFGAGNMVYAAGNGSGSQSMPAHQSSGGFGQMMYGSIIVPKPLSMFPANGSGAFVLIHSFSCCVVGAVHMNTGSAAAVSKHGTNPPSPKKVGSGHLPATSPKRAQVGCADTVAAAASHAKPATGDTASAAAAAPQAKSGKLYKSTLELTDSTWDSRTSSPVKPFTGSGSNIRTDSPIKRHLWDNAPVATAAAAASPAPSHRRALSFQTVGFPRSESTGSLSGGVADSFESEVVVVTGNASAFDRVDNLGNTSDDFYG